jgi:hypothetical protein
VRFQTLVSDINNVIFATDQDKNIHALHSFKVTGGTLLRPKVNTIAQDATMEDIPPTDTQPIVPIIDGRWFIIRTSAIVNDNCRIE